MDTSRRDLLKKAAFTASVVFVPWSARGQAKATKQQMQYQDQPKNGQTCDTCLHWIPGSSPTGKGGCKLVEGDIDPKGWCLAWAKKA